MNNDERVGEIDYYKQQLAHLSHNQFGMAQAGYWQRLTDYCNKMSADQQIFVNNNSKVQEARASMMEAFNLFLFERYKEDFAQVENFQKLCDTYIDTVIETSKDYSKQVLNTANENANLKARIAELERKLNDKSNSSGT